MRHQYIQMLCQSKLEQSAGRDNTEQIEITKGRDKKWQKEDRNWKAIKGAKSHY